MFDTVLSLVADSSHLPIAVIGQDGVLLAANKALRQLVDDDVIAEADRRRGASLGRRVIFPTRTGGAVALDVIPAPGGTGGWILRGEESVRRAGLAEESSDFAVEPAEGQSVLEMTLIQAARRAEEQGRSVALLLLEPLGLARFAVDQGQVDASEALAALDRCLVGNLRAADYVLPQDDGTRAIVALVTDQDGATTLAERLASVLARPLKLHGAERVVGVRIGIACADGPLVRDLETNAREALDQACLSKRPFLSMAEPCAA